MADVEPGNSETSKKKNKSGTTSEMQKNESNPEEFNPAAQVARVSKALDKTLGMIMICSAFANMI